MFAPQERKLAELEKDLSRDPALAAVSRLFPGVPLSTMVEPPASASRHRRRWVLVVSSLLAALGWPVPSSTACGRLPC